MGGCVGGCAGRWVVQENICLTDPAQDLMAALVRRGADPNTAEPGLARTALRNATVVQGAPLFGWLLQRGGSPERLYAQRRSPLVLARHAGLGIAVSDNRVVTTEALPKAGAKPNVCDAIDWCPLCHAQYRASLDLVRGWVDCV